MKTINPYELSIVDKLALEDEFFKTPFLMSYSGLNKLLYSPGAFYNHYVLKQKADPSEKAMIEGKVIHCLLLTPELFEEQFIVMPEDIPSENPKKVLDRLFTHVNEVYPEILEEDDPAMAIAGHTGIQGAIIDILKDENLYQSLKTDEQRVAKIMTDRNLSYFIYLLYSKNRQVIDQQTFDFASTAVQFCKQKPHLKKLMGIEENFVPGLVHNELPMVSFPKNYSFGLKGIIDNLVIDHDQKVIRINDVKKSSKPLNLFSESIEYYKYWMQCSMYKKLVDHTKLTAFGVDYPIEFRFVVIDPYMQVAALKVSNETMDKWTQQTEDALNIAETHFKYKDFSLPIEFLTSDFHEHTI